MIMNSFLNRPLCFVTASPETTRALARIPRLLQIGPSGQIGGIWMSGVTAFGVLICAVTLQVFHRAFLSRGTRVRTVFELFELWPFLVNV